MKDDQASRFQERINGARRSSQRRSSSNRQTPERRRSSASEELKQLDPAQIIAALEHFAEVDDQDHYVEYLESLKESGSMQDHSSSQGTSNRRSSKRGSHKSKMMGR